MHVQSINYLQCHVVPLQNEQKLKTDIWSLKTLLSNMISHFYIMTISFVISARITQFRVMTTSEQDCLWLPVILSKDSEPIITQSGLRQSRVVTSLSLRLTISGIFLTFLEETVIFISNQTYEALQTSDRRVIRSGYQMCLVEHHCNVILLCV